MIASILSGVVAVAAAPNDPFDPLPYIHPELRPFVDKMKQYTGSEELTTATLPAARQRTFGAPPRATPAWMERTIPGQPGAPDLKIYVINAGKPGDPLRPAILYIHGGGFVTGDAKPQISYYQELASKVDCVIVAVNYRLAPETRFPGSLEDNYAGLRWLHRNASALGVDGARLAVMGESAGGGHAAMLAIAARDRGEIPLAFQALIYPMLDDRTGSTRRMPRHLAPVIWNEQENRFGWASLLGVPAGSANVPNGAVPARVENLRGLPPAFIGVGSIDLFIGEDIEYARCLIDAGVQVELNVVPGAFHGFDFIETTRIAQRFRAALVEALKNAFAATNGDQARSNTAAMP